MDNTICKEAGKRIRTIRKERGYSRNQLAEKAGISSKFLYEIEQGRKKFSAETLCCIVSVLEISCDYVMFGDAEKEGQEEGLTDVISLFDKEQRHRVIPLLKSIYELLNVNHS